MVAGDDEKSVCRLVRTIIPKLFHSRLGLSGMRNVVLELTNIKGPQNGMFIT